MNFINFKEAVRAQLDSMSKYTLFEVDIDGDAVWDTYLSSFPEGTNPIYRERTEHDCSCCKSFIRNIGKVVSIVDGKLTSVWDIEVGGHFQVVADALSKKIKARRISNIYLNGEVNVGTDKNHEDMGEEGIKTWEHFHYKLPNKFVNKTDIGTVKGHALANKEVLQRSLNEISSDSIDIVLDLISQNSLYRGDEHKAIVLKLKEIAKVYSKVCDSHKQMFLWEKSVELKESGRIKNTVIGTLLADISEGTDLEVAVKKYESKVAPENYKRPTALITQGMIKKAQKTIDELGLEDSLARRYAVTEDITINNVLFADRAAKKSMGVLDVLEGSVKDSAPNLDKVQEVTVDKFVEDILPNVDSMEVMVDNNQVNNFVSLIAPIHSTAKPLFKWANPFSWTYNGEVTDSIKERVRAKGGNVSGELRFSLSWFNFDDLDIHIVQPNGQKIYHGRKRGYTSGILDVDMNAGSGASRNAVENVTWQRKSSMAEGTYHVIVNNYEKRESSDVGFEVEMEFMGKTTLFVCPKAVPNKNSITVLTFNYTHKNGVEIVSSIPTGSTSKDVWGVSTNKWLKVDMLMHSPNHWDGEQTGNKHWFFMLDKCINPDKGRGFYNEFLSNDLKDHRKVFEVLGSKLKAEESDTQLSGVGFSSTQRNEVLCRVKGSFNRTLKIKF